ncbi:glycosyltransferase [Micromonospora sp. WMMD1082]|uniref:glycosyltransferase n=1 Tax=Micromonospora sp. WMMD1082 TaxID=3016104 RepID=UPI0024176727|nr:glycosyltransferase [Micromonospora sp. WMMD1082]MDG4792829.1 glycosyltransferase [Micromonospora sp. WMMD1082]
MPRSMRTDAEVSVVIPTYNRSAALRLTLEHLARQRLPVERFEVIVTDDGSSDDTRVVVEEAAGSLRIRYHFQPDDGFRAGAARNAGARLATAPMLSFLDTGTFVAPEYLERLLAEYAGGERLAVIGYAYGYDIDGEMPGLAEAMEGALPEDVVARFRDEPAFFDPRHRYFAAADFDLGRLAAPWVLFWSLNCSVRANDFWRVGGFDEEFHRWGIEDLELAYRMFKDGVNFRLTRSAWAVHAPQGRDRDANMADGKANIAHFIAQHPEPPIEVVWKVMQRTELLDLEENYQFLLSWADKVRTVDVADEVERELPHLDAAGRTAVLGAGGRVPAGLSPAVLLDFDADLLTTATSGTSHVAHHAIGLRTPVADDAVENVLLTSRLAGLWSRWGADFLLEAHRIGRSVRLTDELARQVHALRRY